MRSSSGNHFSSWSMSMVSGFFTRPSIATVQGRVCSLPAFPAGSSLSDPNS
jgi:hypothetical protein